MRRLAAQSRCPWLAPWSAAVLIITLGGSACSGGSPRPARPTTSSSTAAPTAAFVAVHGYLTTTYVRSKGKCEDLFGGGGLAEGIEVGLAKAQVEKVEGRTIDVRNEQGTEVASATTAQTADLATTDEQSDDPKYDICLALASYSAQIPSSAGSVVLSVEGVSGAPHPITIAELQALNDRCDLHIHTDGTLLEDDPCQGGGWGRSVEP